MIIYFVPILRNLEKRIARMEAKKLDHAEYLKQMELSLLGLKKLAQETKLKRLR
jgi:hypothetical protein